MTKPLYVRSLRRLAALALLGAVLYLAGSQARLRLSLTALGCDLLWSDGRCERAEDAAEPLRLFIRPGSSGPLKLFLWTWQDHRLRLVDTSAGEPAEQLLWKPRVPALTSTASEQRLLVVAWHGLRLGLGTLSLRRLAQPRWLRDAAAGWKEKTESSLRSAASILTQRLLGELAPGERAQALGLLGVIRRQQGDVAGARDLLRRAVRADREVGLISNEAMDAFRLASLLGQLDHQPREAEALLLEHAAALERMPGWLPFVLLNRALYKELQGDLPSALPLVKQGLRWAELLADAKGKVALRTLLLRMLDTQGLATEAQELRRQAVDESEDGCPRGYALEALAQSQLAAWSASWPTLDRASDPRPALQQALAIWQGPCASSNNRVTVQLDLLRAALLREDRAQAAALLDQLHASVPSDPLSSAARAELEVQHALMVKDFAAAQRGAQALLQTLLPSLDPLLSEALSHRLRVALASASEGQAEALLAQADPTAAQRLFDEAIAHYLEAERLLDQIARHLPLSFGGGGHLGGKQRGTILLLDLLLRRERHSEALAVMRHARTRALQALAPLGQIDAQRTLTMQARYQVSRAALDQLAQQAPVGTTSQRALADEQRHKRAELLAGMQELVQQLGSADPPAPAPPAPGELLLTCHRVLRGSYCLGADTRQTVGFPVTDLNDPAQLFPPALAPLLTRAQVLKVLPQGELRRVLVHLLPWQGRPLWEKLTVVYSLDLANRPLHLALPADARRALVVVHDNRGSIWPTIVEPMRRKIPLLLRELGFTTLFEPSLARGRLMDLLSRVDLFFYYGHIDSSGIHGLDRLADSDVLVSDLLAASRLPRWLILIGCETGQGGEASGGHEALTLASAALLRGADWVIGATAKLDPREAGSLSLALPQADLRLSPVAALRRLQQQARTPAALATINALRVFVP